MSKITARGKLFGFQSEVIIEQKPGQKMVMTIDGTEQNELLELYMDNIQPIGGTYYPTKWSMLAALSVMQNSVFDSRPATIDVDGDIGTIPHTPGVIY